LHIQTMKQYLRAFCNYQHNNWVELLPLAEFANNIPIHRFTLMTPFWGNYNHHSTMQYKPPKDPSFRPQWQADSWMAGGEETHGIHRGNIIDAPERHTK
jgi:hypothetical protein